MPFQNDKILLKRISAGDEDAFRLLFDRYKHRLIRFVSQLVDDEADAQDIVQDTFIKVWQAAYLIQLVDNPEQYLYRIARNKTLNYLRNANRNNERLRQYNNLYAGNDQCPEEQLDYQDCMHLIHQAIRMLPEKKKRIFELSRQQGFTHEQIAVEMGLSQSRVKNTIVETIKFLKQYLAANGQVLILLYYLLS